MDRTTKIMAIATAGASLLAMLLATPGASAQSRQQTKNNMRNLGIAAGAGALYEAAHGKTGAALALGAGAAYAGKKYEDTRKQQNQHHHRYYRHRRH